MKTQRIVRLARMVALRERAEKDDEALGAYETATSFSEIGESDLVNTVIAVPPNAPLLVLPTKASKRSTSYDADHAILVHDYLPDLNRTQAADARLWMTLAHTTFWDYTRARWGVKNRAKLRNSVLQHWFVPRSGGKSALRRHAISGLWWAAHLTRAPWDQDPALECFRSADRFHFTRVLLSQKQIYFDVVERDFGSDLRLRICFLDALAKHMPSVSWKDGLSRSSSKQVNLLVKHRQIASTPIATLRALCDSIVAREAKALAGAKDTGPVDEPDEPGPETDAA